MNKIYQYCISCVDIDNDEATEILNNIKKEITNIKSNTEFTMVYNDVIDIKSGVESFLGLSFFVNKTAVNHINNVLSKFPVYFNKFEVTDQNKINEIVNKNNE